MKVEGSTLLLSTCLIFVTLSFAEAMATIHPVFWEGQRGTGTGVQGERRVEEKGSRGVTGHGNAVRKGVALVKTYTCRYPVIYMACSGAL